MSHLTLDLGWDARIFPPAVVAALLQHSLTSLNLKTTIIRHDARGLPIHPDKYARIDEYPFEFDPKRPSQLVNLSLHLHHPLVIISLKPFLQHCTSLTTLTTSHVTFELLQALPNPLATLRLLDVHNARPRRHLQAELFAILLDEQLASLSRLITLSFNTRLSSFRSVIETNEFVDECSRRGVEVVFEE